MRNGIFAMTLLVCSAFICQAQTPSENLYQPASQSNGEILSIAEVMPEFPGGQDKLLEYFGKIKYPNAARRKKIEGTVFVEFIIEKDGSVGFVNVRKGVDEILDEAAVDQVKNMPNWKPGTQDGKPVRVQFIVPIKFRLI